MVYRLARIMLAPLLRYIFKPTILGRENMPTDGPCFLLSNHANTYDGFLINLEIYSSPTATLLTEEYFRGGLVTFLFKSIGAVPTKKFLPQVTPVREIIRYIRDRRMFIIMPEGERNWDGITRPTVISTGKLYRKLGVPVHPVIIHNGYLSWPRWAPWPRRIATLIEFKPPLEIHKDMTDEEVARLVDQSIRWHPEMDENLLPPASYRAFRPADGINKLIYRCPACTEEGGLRVRRGRFLICRQCDSRWEVGGDSYLTNTATGERASSTAVFQKINEFKRERKDFDSFGFGLTMQKSLPVYFEAEFPDQVLLGKFHCVFDVGEFRFYPKKGSKPTIISHDDVRSISIEKKYKLQIRLDAGLYQINFVRGSALQWETYLRDLLPTLSRGLIDTGFKEVDNND